MKKYTTLLVAIFLLFLNLLYGQRSKNIKNSEVKGIFLTYTDFKQNKLVCSSLKQNKHIKIKLNQFFISPTISCFELQKHHVFYKDSIFGIQLENGDNYRFINRKPCFIADTSFLIIYTCHTVKTEYKQSGPTRRFKEIPITYYYFSSEQHKKVYSLTMANICKYLNIESDIKTAIIQKFYDDEMLYLINPKTGHFIINELLKTLNSNHQ